MTQRRRFTPTFKAQVMPELLTWARRIGVEPREIHIRVMRHKWASCSLRERLTFDRGLLQQPAHFRAEVIVHELLHLKVPNHGKLFRALLQAYLVERSDLHENLGPNHA